MEPYSTVPLGVNFKISALRNIGVVGSLKSTNTKVPYKDLSIGLVFLLNGPLDADMLSKFKDFLL